MCGICGIIHNDPGRPVNRGVLSAMTRAMVHRGPDDEGFFVSGNAGLGMRRLSIIDVAGGRQPMVNEDGAVTVVFNGEIYNHAELRKTLAARGHVFKTRCDTEVLAHLYEEHGPDMVDHLNGMFAFAIWDGREKRLFVARDRLGIKPLYYTEADGSLLFASEIKSLLCYPGLRARVDPEALHHFLTLRFTPSPFTGFAGIKKLTAGHSLSWKSGRTGIRRYWDVPAPGETQGVVDDCVEETRALVEDAVSMRLMSDVPLGVMLSGGVDSSVILAAMARSGQGPVSAFTIRYPEKGAHNEEGFARMAADAFGARLSPVAVDFDGFLDGLSEMVRHLEEPLADMAAFPIWRICEAARPRVTVLLSGMGGDEVFGGYNSYREALFSSLLDRVPLAVYNTLALPLSRALPAGAPGKNFLARARLPVQQTFLGSSFVHGGFSEAQKQALYLPEVSSAQRGFDTRRLCETVMQNSGPRSRLGTMMLLDTRLWLADSHLIMTDKMSMAASIEVRAPFLDHRLVEAAARFPDRSKVGWSGSKICLKKAFEDVVPRAIIQRKKRGFSTPADIWFKRHTGRMAGVFLAPDARVRRFFSARAMKERLLMHEQGEGDQSAFLFTLLVLELWMKTFIDG